MSDFFDEPQYEPSFIVPPEEISTPILRRELIKSDIQNAINAGLTVEQTIRAYRDAGLQFTDSVVRDIYHTAKGEMTTVTDERLSKILSLPLDDTISDSWRKQSTWEYSERYVDTVRLTVYVEATGETKDIFFRYYHDSVLTARETIEAAMEVFNEPEEGTASYYYAVSGSVVGAEMSQNFI